MKTLITIIALAVSIGVQANHKADEPFVKFVSTEEELINPFTPDFHVADLADSIRQDRQITDSEIADETNETDMNGVIAEDIKITEAVLPSYEPLDWAKIMRSHKPLRTTVIIGTNL